MTGIEPISNERLSAPTRKIVRDGKLFIEHKGQQFRVNGLRM